MSCRSKRGECCSVHVYGEGRRRASSSAQLGKGCCGEACVCSETVSSRGKPRMWPALLRMCVCIICICIPGRALKLRLSTKCTCCRITVTCVQRYLSRPDRLSVTCMVPHFLRHVNFWRHVLRHLLLNSVMRHQPYAQRHRFPGELRGCIEMVSFQ